jgi:hypothetical protein
MAAADLEAKLGFDTAIFTALPPPVLYITLGVLGIVLWANMTEQCDDYYAKATPLLLGIFHIQVLFGWRIEGYRSVWENAFVWQSVGTCGSLKSCVLV